jgi:hypothetical protein
MPSEAVLERGNLLFPLFVLLPMLFILIGAGGIYFTWRAKPIAGAKSQPISTRATSRMGARTALVFFSIFLAVGAGLLYALLIRPVYEVLQAKHWVQVPCVVISSEVQRHSGNHGDTYSVNIFYSYELIGHEYKANRYDFMGGSSSGYGSKRQIVDQHPPGSRSICFVNPNDPTEAVLERGFIPTMWLGLLPLLFVLVGVAGLTSTLRRGGSSALTGRRTGQTGLFAPPYSSPASGLDSAPVVLKPRATPLTKLIVIALFALFWNGMVWVFLASALRGSHSSGWHWFPVLFMVPFVLVGLGLLGLGGYLFLALFNPRPHLTVTPGAVPLGGTLQVQWELK